MNSTYRDRLDYGETLPRKAVAIATGVQHRRLPWEGVWQFEGTGTPQRMAARGVFVMVGAAPNTSWLPANVSLDPKGFVLTGDAAGASSQYATSVPGIFAVGDVRAGSVKRVASAVGEGSVCVSSVWAHVQDR